MTESAWLFRLVFNWFFPGSKVKQQQKPKTATTPKKAGATLVDGEDNNNNDNKISTKSKKKGKKNDEDILEEMNRELDSISLDVNGCVPLSLYLTIAALLATLEDCSSLTIPSQR
jgi:hypothetical protein